MVSRYSCLLGAFLAILLFWGSTKVGGQPMMVNLSVVEGSSLNAASMLGFQIHSMASGTLRCQVEGVLRFRHSDQHIRYTFEYMVRPGINQIDTRQVQPRWSFSSPGLGDLFMTYGVLPEGSYQYCVEVTALIAGGDGIGGAQVDDCLFGQQVDLFSLQLVSPPDDARLYEFHPLLSWVATYPFASALSYRLRIAEIKEGQTSMAAISRNPPIFSSTPLMISSLVYPMDARSLELGKSYAWTVDASYRGIELGGSEVWKFTIVADSLMEALPRQTPYVEVNTDDGRHEYLAIGEIKLQYQEQHFLSNELELMIVRSTGSAVDSSVKWPVRHGINFTELDLSVYSLRHKESFELVIVSAPVRGVEQRKVIKYKYINPLYVR